MQTPNNSSISNFEAPDANGAVALFNVGAHNIPYIAFVGVKNFGSIPFTINASYAAQAQNGGSPTSGQSNIPFQYQNAAGTAFAQSGTITVNPGGWVEAALLMPASPASDVRLWFEVAQVNGSFPTACGQIVVMTTNADIDLA